MAFELQRHLELMEGRIREDVATLRTDLQEHQERLHEVAITAEEQAGRIRTLEEKAGWISAGFGAGFLALIGFVWHIIMSSKGGVP